MVSTSLETRFQTLCNEAAACRICPELADKAAVLSPLNGTLSPKVFFVAEAPGRQGADRTRRPFYGDKSGDNFQTLLDSISLSRDEIFITNSVMCSPRTATDANRKPSRMEIRNCSGYLQRQIALLRPMVVATLGSVALGAIKVIEDHGFTLKQDAGKTLEWNDRTLVPLYHPSPQVAAAQRGLGRQLEHFQSLASVL